MNELEPIAIMAKDIRDGGTTLSPGEARFLVDLYYAMQEHRVATSNQASAMDRALACSACNWHGAKTHFKGHGEDCPGEAVPDPEPHKTISWFVGQMETLERQVFRALDAYSAAQPLGRWARSIVGIGPVISAGLMAHIDLVKAPTVGHVWRFAGQDPTSKWGKGQKRPWNASLKVLCWKIGESFVKVSGHDDDIYGHVYAARKAEEIGKNDAGLFREQAAAALVAKRYRDDTTAKKCYENGKLPPAHVHARAKRYATKLFLAHYWETGRRLAGLDVPSPYPIAILGHAHKIEPPA